MKLLHLTSDWKWTGPAEPMLHAVTGLRELGHHVDLACAGPPNGVDGGLLPHARERGVELVHQLARGQGWWPFRDRFETKRLRDLFARERYDLIHVHHTRDHLLAVRANAHLSIPLVSSWHHGEAIPGSPWNRWLYASSRTHGLVVLSDSLAAAARCTFGGAPERITAVPGCVDTDGFVPRLPSVGLGRELGVGIDDCVVGVVARLQPHRRFELLLEALRRARAKESRLRLLVVGRGTRAREVLEEPVHAMGLGEAVIQAGYRGADYRDALSLMRALVFLVPGSDGSCRAVLEAMSMGIPTLATRRGLLPETVVDGETGVLFDEDPDALASALVDLARRSDVWRSRGRAARKRVLNSHPIGHIAERLERYYATLVSGVS